MAGGRSAARAAALVAACLLALPAGAAAKSYKPPAKKMYFGVSDTGEVEAFEKFESNVRSHPAVLQTFHTWGFHPWRALDRWARTQTRGMLSVGTSECYDCAGVITPKEIAKGWGDDYPLTLARRFAAEKETVYIRLFAEMNGHWNDYSAYNQDGSSRGVEHSTKWFRKAWRRFAIIVRGGSRRAVNRRLEKQGLPPVLRAQSEDEYRSAGVGRRLPRPRVALMWVPQSTGSPNVAGNEPRDYWPGRRWVDWVGVDIYAKFPNFGGMKRIYRQYKSKPFVIGEWSSWDRDSPTFVKQLFGFARRHKRVRLLVYYQGFEAFDPHRIWRYPGAQETLRRKLNHRSIREYAPGSRRPPPSDSGDQPVGEPPQDDPESPIDEPSVP